jgi:anti-sigma regulatory factor (Ser/Thr protein kinase)
MMQRLTQAPYKDKKIHVKLSIGSDDMWVSISDEGDGFDFKNRIGVLDSEEMFKSSGRGLLLISSLMDEVSFNENGNEIRMRKLRSSMASFQREAELQPAV